MLSFAHQEKKVEVQEEDKSSKRRVNGRTNVEIEEKLKEQVE